MGLKIGNGLEYQLNMALLEVPYFQANPACGLMVVYPASLKLAVAVKQEDPKKASPVICISRNPRSCCGTDFMWELDARRNELRKEKKVTSAVAAFTK